MNIKIKYYKEIESCYIINLLTSLQLLEKYTLIYN